MEAAFETLSTIIRERRTIKPAQMNGNIIPDEQIRQLIALADWAPTHGNTEPWRFFIWAGREKVDEFCRQHAELYKANTPETGFNPTTYNNLGGMGAKASHVMIAVMQRGTLDKIPALEEVAATSAAIQNLLLGAEALGLAAYWGSGGQVLKPGMKTWLGLRDEDTVMGALYLGHTDVEKAGNRQIPLDEKMIWM
jgi:nitroreductase